MSDLSDELNEVEEALEDLKDELKPSAKGWKDPKGYRFWGAALGALLAFGVAPTAIWNTFLAASAEEIAYEQGITIAWESKDSCNVKAAKLLDLQTALHTECQYELSPEQWELMCFAE